MNNARLILKSCYLCTNCGNSEKFRDIDKCNDCDSAIRKLNYLNQAEKSAYVYSYVCKPCELMIDRYLEESVTCPLCNNEAGYFGFTHFLYDTSDEEVNKKNQGFINWIKNLF